MSFKSKVDKKYQQNKIKKYISESKTLLFLLFVLLCVMGAWVHFRNLYYENQKFLFIILTVVCLINFIGTIKLFSISEERKKRILLIVDAVLVTSLVVIYFMSDSEKINPVIWKHLLLLPFSFILLYLLFREYQYEKSEKEQNIRQEIAEKEKIQYEIERQKEQENLKKKKRDADYQNSPFIYEIGTDANEALAIRYGIANTQSDKTTPSSTIKLQKFKRIQDNHYEVLLTDYRDRKARAVIEPGTNYVKTFYPMEKKWFEEQGQLEVTLKGNGTFTLKELATFHVQKTV
jgi:hypothetical protein